MIGSLVQFDANGRRGVAALDQGGAAHVVEGAGTILDLANAALAAGRSLASLAGERSGEAIALESGRLLCPIAHPDPAHLLVSGTGLTHLGSAEGRNKMHQAAAAGNATDSMRMFMMGLEGGKPKPGMIGAQPEWFYKGDGSILVDPGEPLPVPGHALDGSEEPEIAGIYLIDDAGRPVRLGFALGNEFSDHVTERENYLWLAHSKLRSASLGPELRLGQLPQNITGSARVTRNGRMIWEKTFLSGEANMSHTIANLEHHHFKYPQFRRPGDIHVHFFGTATLSFSDDVAIENGDMIDIHADCFRYGLSNKVSAESDDGMMKVHEL